MNLFVSFSAWTRHGPSFRNCLFEDRPEPTTEEELQKLEAEIAAMLGSDSSIITILFWKTLDTCNGS